MKRLKSEPPSVRRSSFLYLLLAGAAAVYLTLIFFKFPGFLESTVVFSDGSFDRFSIGDDEGGETSKSHLNSVYSSGFHRKQINESQHASVKPQNNARLEVINDHRPNKQSGKKYGRITAYTLRRMNETNNLSLLERMADEAWALGLKAWEELGKYDEKEIRMSTVLEGKPESCPSWISLNGEELAKRGDIVIFIPCGLAAGSSITITGTPRHAHEEYLPQFVKTRADNPLVHVSQFMVELQGLKSVDGEDPPKILHLNPRLRGDWSYRPVIEHNTCYRMQWGTAQRCDGLPSKNDGDMLVDGYLRCEKWMHEDIIGSKESKILPWFDRFAGRAKKPEVTWPFPFREGRMFILTIHAGVDGFHINIGGRHVTSFPYRTGFTLEDATGLAIKGDVDVLSVYATSLPNSHPSFSPNRVLDFSETWKSRSATQGHVQLFIGVLSATNHFAERMAVRKTWMQSLAVSSKVAVRFFVALNPRTEVNAILRKEAAYFGDIEILPFMDRYELVVLKTIAICEYGVKNLTAEYIMKCDDDTFIRIDTILKEIKSLSPKSSLYLGNLNLLHRPLRTGKWAVSYEEWPEEIYPPYANGPGYVISNDIANYIVSQRANHSLRLFKMEDVSMGMWVEKFNSTKRVQYSHNWKLCQYGCMEGYYTAHYQSPRQMICLWDNLMKDRASCCNF